MHQDNVMCYHTDSIDTEVTTMPDILIRKVPSKIVTTLKARARKNKRSLQLELLDLLEREAKTELEEQAKAQAEAEFWAWAAKMRAKLKGRPQSDSTLIIRKARDSR